MLRQPPRPRRWRAAEQGARRLIPGLLRRGGGRGVAEGWDQLLREGVEIFELNLERGAERRRANDRPGRGRDSASRPPSARRRCPGPAGQEAVCLHRILDHRQFHAADQPRVAHRRDLVVG